jgi:ribosomal protein S18 acetylase RimI-like enzyme
MGSIKITLLTEPEIADFLDAAAIERGETEWQRLARFANDMTRGERSIWVAQKDEQIVGMVSVRWDSEYPGFRLEPKSAEIIDLYVWQHARRQGIADKLMDTAEEAIEDRDFACAGLLVGIKDSDMPAWQLYLERGYVFDGSGGWWQGQKVGDLSAINPQDEPILLAMEKSL